VKNTTVARQGSILIFVLWILAMLAYLAGDYLAHNRERAAVCSNSWNVEKENQAINSVIELFSADRSPLSGQEEENGWIALSPGGVKLWVRLEKEAHRVNVNSAPDSEIRKKIVEVTADESEDKADQLSDAILDWRDPDKLTRQNGAEAGYYRDQGLPYVPGDGPFKALTELLLVRGMNSGLFWGNPLASVNAQTQQDKESGDRPLSVSDAFTVFDADVKRLTVVVPGRGKSYELALVFMKKKGVRWQAFQVYRTTLVSDGKEDKFGDQ